jgi:hypothetical protein
MAGKIMSEVSVSDADITEACRQLRQEAGGHEPWALSVWPRALQIATEREQQAKP